MGTFFSFIFLPLRVTLYQLGVLVHLISKLDVLQRHLKLIIASWNVILKLAAAAATEENYFFK